MAEPRRADWSLSPLLPSLNRQGRWLIGVELHIEGGQHRRRRGVISHQRHEVDKLLPAEQFQRAREGLRADLACREDLTPEFDDGGIGLVEAAGVPAMTDRLDDPRRQPLASRFFLVRGPFELAVEFARG